MNERRLKVLCVTGYPDRPEAHTFIGLAARGHHMRVLCAPDAPTFGLLESSAVDVVPFKIEQRIDRRAIAALRREIAAFEPDVLHLFANKAVLNGLWAARGADVRIVVYRGNVGNVSVFDPLSWMRYLNPRVDRIVCVSDSVRDYLASLRLVGWRIPPRKLVTIHKGHDLSWYQAAPVDLAALGVPRDAFVVGCVANWRPRKGIEVLLRACARLAGEIPLHVVLVGDGMPNPSLDEEIAGRLDPERVHFLSYRTDAPAVAAAFDVAVLPAIKREGLPKTVIEAMVYGVATVASRVGGVEELIEDGVSGLIVPPGDVEALAAAIRRLYDSPGLRADIGRQGRERIRAKFRIEDTVARTAALYESLVTV